MVKLLFILSATFSQSSFFINSLSNNENEKIKITDIKENLNNFEIEMRSLTKNQNIEILTLILNDKNNKIFDLNFITQNTKEILFNFNFNDEIKESLKDDLQYLKSNKEISRKKGSWTYNKYHKVMNKRYFLRWNWWTWVSGFFCLEASPELVDLITKSTLGTAEGINAVAELLEILAPIISVPFVGQIFFAGLALNTALIFGVWDSVDDGAGKGIYGDFVLTIPGKTVKSKLDWASIR